MAIITPSPTISAISGKVGGVIFSSSTRVPTVSARPRSKNIQSDGQLLHRARFQSLSSLWRGLSTTNRQAWRDATQFTMKTNRLGVIRQQSAFQLFMSVNLNRLAEGLDYSPTPPSNLTPVDYLDAWDVANYHGITVKVYCPLTSVTDPVQLKFRYIRTMAMFPDSTPRMYSPWFYVAATPGTFIYDLEDFYAPYTGHGSIGEQVFFDLSYTADNWRPGAIVRENYILTTAIPP